MILNNGSDAQNADLYAFGEAAALEPGWSFCGGSAARAAAYDDRLAAAVDDMGVISLIAPWDLDKRQGLVNAGTRGASTRSGLSRSPTSPSLRFSLAKRSEVYAQPKFDAHARYLGRFMLSAATICRIKAPTMVTQAENEQFYPGQSGQVYRRPRAPKKLQRGPRRRSAVRSNPTTRSQVW